MAERPLERLERPSHGNILVVDDNYQLGEFAAQLPWDLGYTTEWVGAPAQGPYVVDLAAYLRALCSNFGQQLETIAIQAEVSLSIDRTVPLGLVVNEVITNSVTHTSGDQGGQISVKLTAGVGYGEARLTISDNGRGIQEARGHGSGLRLVEALPRQIGGELDQQSSSKGTMTTVVFPVIS